MLILANIIEKTPHTLSQLLKNVRYIQLGTLWILQLNLFKTLERVIASINYETFFHVIFMTG